MDSVYRDGDNSDLAYHLDAKIIGYQFAVTVIAHNSSSIRGPVSNWVIAFCRDPAPVDGLPVYYPRGVAPKPREEEGIAVQARSILEDVANILYFAEAG